MDPILKDIRARPRRTGTVPLHTYRDAAKADDALEAADCAASFLRDLARMDLGHDGDHAVAEALRNLRAVRRFLRSARSA